MQLLPNLAGQPDDHVASTCKSDQQLALTVRCLPACLQACIPVVFSSAVSVKNHNEILRCFAVISEHVVNWRGCGVMGLVFYAVAAKGYSNKVVGFLLQKLELAQEKVRLATLDILKHVINSCSKC